MTANKASAHPECGQSENVEESQVKAFDRPSTGAADGTTLQTGLSGPALIGWPCSVVKISMTHKIATVPQIYLPTDYFWLTA